jgi:hypothetical protein
LLALRRVIAVTPLLLLIAAIACLGAALVLLRSLGDRYRVGRLLAAAPLVEIEAAREMAARDATYVRVNGRITSDEEFPDENDRPLVFRRKRIDIGDRGGWKTIADEREAVPFGIEMRGAFIAVDEAGIGGGLVAIPRESVGVVADLPAGYLDSVTEQPASDTPARLAIEQLSAVEQATVCGTPVLRDGQPMMTAGKGRPLIVTTLDQPAAMRLLAAGYRSRVLAAAVLVAAAIVLVGAWGVAVIAGI